MSEALRAPGSTATLRPLQAIALAEIAVWGGAFVPLPVGAGKTLFMLLAARVLPRAQRPLYLMPAGLIAKTLTEEIEYRRQWVLPALRQIKSYESLGPVGGADYLGRYRPDLIVADEAHALKNPAASVTRRVMRYLDAERPIFAPMTGTPYSTSIRDFAHLVRYALPRTNPIPVKYLDLDEWARVLDTDVAEHRRLAPGALSMLCAPGEDVRSGFRRRLGDTPGVILSTEPQLPIPLDATCTVTPLDAAQESALADLRASWDTPDGEPVEDGPAMYRHARELAQGFYQVWDPRAPRDWREARRAWACECREILATNRRNLDSADQLCRYIDAHPSEYPIARDLLAAWRAIEPTFTPNSVPVWISDHVLDWIANRPGLSGLIWTERPAVGHRLARKLRAPYYGEQGICAEAGRSIEAHRQDVHGPIAVLATGPNSNGRNLQAWNRSLILDVTKSARKLEQCLGRTHRPGQQAARVSVEFLIGVREDIDSMAKARERAETAALLTGQPQKILHANGGRPILVPGGGPEPRWQKSKPPAGRGKNMLALLAGIA
jgi:hypothetical protein